MPAAPISFQPELARSHSASLCHFRRSVGAGVGGGGGEGGAAAAAAAAVAGAAVAAGVSAFYKGLHAKDHHLVLVERIDFNCVIAPVAKTVESAWSPLSPIWLPPRLSTSHFA